MERRSLEIKSISCNAVKSFVLFQKPSLFAAVSVTGPSADSKRRQQQKTPVDSTGGANAEWNHPMRFDDLDGQDLILEFDLMASGNLFGDKLVGKAKVPVKDILTECLNGAVRHVSYQVTAPDGKPNGAIRFAYKVSYPEAKLPAVTSPTNDYVYYSPSPASHQVASLPAPDSCCPPPPPPPREQAASLPVRGYGHYPPSTQDAPVYYPSQPPDAGFYPPPQPPVHVERYPPPASFYSPPPPVHVECYPPPASFYPPPPPVHVESYPPPASFYPPPPPGHVESYPSPASIYPPPPPASDPYGYRPESWDRGLYYR